MVSADSGLFFEPVTNSNWDKMQDLFGDKGAYGGCWCTYWRLPRSRFSSCPSSERKEMMKEIIDSGRVPGILAYKNGTPVGWCSIANRSEFVLLANSRTLRSIDDKPVWSVVCFYIHRKERRKGIMSGLLRKAIEYAKTQGAEIVEGYPIDPMGEGYPDPYAYTGFFSAFVELGFVEVERRSPKRPIMRLYIK